MGGFKLVLCLLTTRGRPSRTFVASSRHLGNGDTTHRQTVITLAVIRHNGGQGAGQTDTARIVGLSDINRPDLGPASIISGLQGDHRTDSG